LLECGRDFADQFKEILKEAPADTLKVWTLLDMKNLPYWVKDNMALLGSVVTTTSHSRGAC